MKRDAIKEIVQRALEEDASGRDITSHLLFSSQIKASAQIVAREKGVLCGIEPAKLVFELLDSRCKVTLHVKDGDNLRPNLKVMTMHGDLRTLLAGERTALNFLQHLSGVATLTAKFVASVKGTNAKIYDTRKTIPGLRALQKWAVVSGGGKNHRMHLEEMAMVKDNHLKMVRNRPEILFAIKGKLPKGTALVVEAKSEREVELALCAQADIILLDNMPLSLLKRQIAHIRSVKLTTKIEVSGGISLENVRTIARLGVDRISVGKLTHSAPALDLSMEIREGIGDSP